MALRSVNDRVQVSDLMTAMGQVMTLGITPSNPAPGQAGANTALGFAGGSVLVNDAGPIYLDSVGFPLLLLEEDQTIVQRSTVRAWKKSVLVVCTYMDRYDQNPATFDTLWAAIDLDLRRCVANLEDNPTVWYNSVNYAESMQRVTFSPYGERTVDPETYNVPVVKRQAFIEVGLPSYTSVR